jgi:micrococcal nuclease
VTGASGTIRRAGAGAGAYAARVGASRRTAALGIVALVAILLIGAACGDAAVRPGTPAVASDSAATGTLSASAPAESLEPGPGQAPTGRTETARVVRIVDGDTIVIDRGRGDEKLRYIGVDTPETKKPNTPVQWMGPEATKYNTSLVSGKSVVLERDVSEVDRYGRLLRYVWVEDASQPAGWLFVNLALVAAGYAQVVTYPPDVKYVDLYLAAQAEAREAGRGLWGEPPPTAEPGSTTAPADRAGCDPAYPGVCIPPPPPDLDCGQISERRFKVLPPDPHRFDGDHDGIGCESG